MLANKESDVKVEFAVSAGLNFKAVEVLEFDDDATDDEIRIHYDDWLFSQKRAGHGQCLLDQ